MIEISKYLQFCIVTSQGFLSELVFNLNKAVKEECDFIGLMFASQLSNSVYWQVNMRKERCSGLLWLIPLKNLKGKSVGCNDLAFCQKIIRYSCYSIDQISKGPNWWILHAGRTVSWKWKIESMQTREMCV